MNREQLMAHFAEGWASVPPEQFARAEQDAAALRDQLEAQGVELSNDEVVVALGALISVIDGKIQAHHARGCCSDRLEVMIGGECWKTLGAMTMLLAARRER